MMMTNQLEGEIRQGFEDLREVLVGDELRELIDVFISDADWRISALEQAIARGDREAVRIEAHTLKGAMVNLGAQSISRICGELEQVGRDGALTLAPSLWIDLSRQFRDVRRCCRKLTSEAAAEREDLNQPAEPGRPGGEPELVSQASFTR